MFFSLNRSLDMLRPFGKQSRCLFAINSPVNTFLLVKEFLAKVIFTIKKNIDENSLFEQTAHLYKEFSI